MIYAAKTQPAPTCLAAEKAKRSGTYRCDGVLHTIKSDFFNKCYICELKEPTSINVEHFLPHRGNRDLEFEWDNLFYACAHCNGTKLDKAVYDNILNCTVLTHEVDKKIRYHIDPYPLEEAQITAIENSQPVHNTVELLSNVYNGSTTLRKLEASNIRSLLLKEILMFQGLLLDFYKDEFDANEKEVIKQKIIRQLRTTSSFTAFKRWVIWDHLKIKADFEQYCA